MVDMVPTNASRAAKDVIKAMPIFQSKPNGLMAGSIVLPKTPAYEFSNFSADLSLSHEANCTLSLVFCAITIYFWSIFANRSPGP